MRVAKIVCAVVAFGLPSVDCAILRNHCEIQDLAACSITDRRFAFIIFVAIYFIEILHK